MDNRERERERERERKIYILVRPINLMGKKRVWHCGHCGMPCEIGKVTKKHRHLICPRHGVIASNPLPLLALAAAPIAKKFLGAAAERFASPKQMVQDATPQYSRPAVVRQPVLVDID